MPGMTPSQTAHVNKVGVPFNNADELVKKIDRALSDPALDRKLVIGCCNQYECQSGHIREVQ
jgi:hypothetical protein